MPIAFDDRGEGAVDYPVGTAGECRWNHPCGITVLTPGFVTGADVVPLVFGTSSPTTYTPSRLLLGLGFAAILLALAAWLIASTDWSPIVSGFEDGNGGHRVPAPE